MLAFHQAPLLSDVDPEESAEGTLDPLGLFSIADQMGSMLAPGVRERMSRPRFLTSLAVSVHLSGSFDPDHSAKDGTEPWLAFEWILVEGLVRCLEDQSNDLRGLPGRQKVARAWRDGQPLSKARYLKSPGVFGVHGVYRQLARQLRIESPRGGLDERGYELLRLWEHEQALPGFLTGDGGAGAELRKELLHEMERIMREHPARTHEVKALWREVAEHLNPARAGDEESALIRRWLGSVDAEGDELRAELLKLVEMKSCQHIIESWVTGIPRDQVDERPVHDFMLARPKLSPALRQCLRAIQAYERLARLLQDAFDDCLHEMSCTRGAVHPGRLAEMKWVKRAARLAAQVHAETHDLLKPWPEIAGRYSEQFAAFSGAPPDGAVWVETLLSHHLRIQKVKEKRPWINPTTDGSFVVRALYRRDEGGRGGSAYVHRYRSAPLWSFIQHLNS